MKTIMKQPTDSLSCPFVFLSARHAPARLLSRCCRTSEGRRAAEGASGFLKATTTTTYFNAWLASRDSLAHESAKKDEKKRGGVKWSELNWSEVKVDAISSGRLFVCGPECESRLLSLQRHKHNMCPSISYSRWFSARTR